GFVYGSGKIYNNSPFLLFFPKSLGLESISMAGGHGYGNGTYKGVHLHQPKRWHTITGKGMCAMMWDGDILGKVTDMNMVTNIRCHNDQKRWCLYDTLISSFK
ncbi:hypothetical protein M8C21_006622, partial [Ambrosia artemisiifolia]